MSASVRLRINWPLVALVLGVLTIISAVWLTLVLTNKVAVSSLQTLAGFITGLLTGGGLPLASWWKAKQIDFEMDSDPPKGGRDA